jgi:hypothetical protein
MHYEDQLQIAVANYLAVVLPQSVFWFHPPNGGSRNAREGAKLKKMGTKAGVPDLVFVYAGAAYFIELKAPAHGTSRAGTLSREQKEIHPQIIAAGSPVVVCRSVAEVSDQIDIWKLPRRGR